MTDLIPDCDCIEQIKAKLKIEFNAVCVGVGHLFLHTSYKPLTAKGEPTKRWRNSAERFKYCPFCGRKYVEKERKR